MKFMERYLELQKQKKLLKRDVVQKRNAISGVVFEEGEQIKSCIKHMPVVNAGDVAIINLCCESFCDGVVCQNQNCVMWQKNREYNDAKNKYQDVMASQRDLIRDLLKVRKK